MFLEGIFQGYIGKLHTYVCPKQYGSMQLIPKKHIFNPVTDPSFISNPSQLPGDLTFFFFHPSQICTIMRCRAVAHFFKDLVSKVAWPKIVDPKTRLYILKGQNTKQPEPIYILRA